MTLPTQLLDLNDLARVLNVSRRHAETMLAAGDLPSPIRYGRIRRWHPDLLDEWLRERAAQASSGYAPRAPHGRPRSKD